jgi:hypothetical protein
MKRQFCPYHVSTILFQEKNADSCGTFPLELLAEIAGKQKNEDSYVYALIFGGGLIRLPSLMRNAMRYSFLSDFTSCSTLGTAE